MTATSVAVTDRRCAGECAASSLLIGACICDVGECEGANVSVNVFLHETMTVLTHVAEFDIFYQSIWCWAIGCSS